MTLHPNTQITGAAVPSGRRPATIHEMLTASGVPKSEVLWKIHAVLFAPPARMLDSMRLVMAGRLVPNAEWELVGRVAECASADDLRDAFEEYHCHPLRNRSIWRSLLGRAPRKTRAFQLLRRLQRNQTGRLTPPAAALPA